MHIIFKVFFVLFSKGEFCEEICLSGKSCRQFGQYLCLCEKGKTGKNCEEQGTLSKLFSAYVVFIGHFSRHYNLKLNFQLTMGM